MFGDGRLRNAGIASQCMDCLLALPRQLLKNGPARRIGQGAEHVIGIGCCHTKTIAKWLYVVKSQPRFVVAKARGNRTGAAGSPHLPRRTVGRTWAEKRGLSP